MFFLTVLMSFVLEPFDVTVITCDIPWFDNERLHPILRAELSDIEKSKRDGMILTVDQCTEQSARLRVSGHQGQLERVIQIENIPDEARPRSIALTLGELARESIANEIPPRDEQPPKQIPPTVISTNDELRENSAVASEISPTKEKPPQELPPEEEVATATNVTIHQTSRNEKHFFIGVFLRAFPLVKTIAPEGRFGLRIKTWRFDLRGYAMGWKSKLGKVYLSAAGLTAGPSLWQHNGKVRAGVDALLELGATAAWGKAANDNVSHTPKFNILAGGHLAAWIGIPTASDFQPTMTIEAGWVRGLNVFAGEELQGGFEGPSASIGLSGVW